MLELVLDARHRNLGGGFEVDRVLPAKRRHIGPYILLDHSGPTVHEPGRPFGIAAHPHIGISTISYLFAGEMVHRDSLANTVTILPGEVNWMTSGRGIVHSERASTNFAANGGTLHALQLWVGLTAQHEEAAPDFQHLGKEALPFFEDGGASARLIAGNAYGKTSPLKTFTPQFYLDLRLAQGARFPLTNEHEERSAYIVSGRVNVDGTSCAERHLLIFKPGSDAVIQAEADSIVMLLGGAPIETPHMWWNFVSTRRERIEQAKRDWVEGRFVLPPDDNREFIRLPDEPTPKPEPMS
jgi:redox-sensitive bicupin YhaK (pirin superfamily)